MTAIFKNNCTDQFNSPHGGIPPPGFATLDEAEAKKAEIEKTSMNTATIE